MPRQKDNKDDKNAGHLVTLSRFVAIIAAMWLLHLFVVLFGLIIGSFLNVCIHRIPQGLSVVRPGSRCPHCKSRLRAWENIPLLSFILLRGRCGRCGQPISWTYPAVEALTALVFYLLFLKYGLTLPVVVNAIFFSLLIVLTIIDLFHRILPDVLTLSGTAAGFLLAPLQSAEFFGQPVSSFSAPILAGRYVESLLGILLGAGLLWVTAKLYLLLRKVEGMGYGDIKMMAMIGAFLSWRFAWLTVFIGSLLGALVGFAYIYLAAKDRRYELPFGTFLGFAAMISTLWGPLLIAWYLGLL